MSQEGAGGTDCTCVLKASEADGENGGPVVWKLILESMKHNESCLKRLNVRTQTYYQGVA